MIDPLYLQLFNLVFTSLPPLLFGAFNQDAPDDLLMKNPTLYQQGMRSQVSVMLDLINVDSTFQAYCNISALPNVLILVGNSGCVVAKLCGFLCTLFCEWFVEFLMKNGDVHVMTHYHFSYTKRLTMICGTLALWSRQHWCGSISFIWPLRLTLG